jgi:sugar phosphate isomerase/epimerase
MLLFVAVCFITVTLALGDEASHRTGHSGLQPDFVKVKEADEQLQKALKLAAKLEGAVGVGQGGDVKFASSLTEMKASMEAADKLVAEIQFAAKYKKKYDGEVVDQDTIDIFASNASALAASLVADMKDVRCHSMKK